MQTPELFIAFKITHDLVHSKRLFIKEVEYQLVVFFFYFGNNLKSNVDLQFKTYGKENVSATAQSDAGECFIEDFTFNFVNLVY